MAMHCRGIIMATMKINDDFPVIERKESYNHRTTPLVEWRVWYKGRIVRECRTRKEAQEWVKIYSI
jgi:hypothetical protein